MTNVEMVNEMKWSSCTINGNVFIQSVGYTFKQSLVQDGCKSTKYVKYECQFKIEEGTPSKFTLRLLI